METQTKKGMTSFAIKVVAIVTMFIDHTAAVFLERQIANPGKAFVSGSAYYYKIIQIDRIMRGIGRIAFPLFIFLMVQGFVHTKSRLKYAIRLGLFVLISEIPFDMAFQNSYFDLAYQNVFFTLFIGFLFMCISDAIRNKHIPAFLGYIGLILSSVTIGYLLMTGTNSALMAFNYSIITGISYYAGIALCAAIVVGILIFACRRKTFEDLSKVALIILALAVCATAAELLKTDYGAAGVLAIAAAYRFRDKKMLCFGAAFLVLTLMNFFEIFSAVGFIFIYFYNGQKGRSMKYFFYAFYPCHLLLIALIAKFLGL